MFGTSWRTGWAWLWAALAFLFSAMAPAALAADYTAGAELNGSTATLWFKSNVGSSWVDAHYRIDGGAQQNLRMSYNGAAARFETTFPGSAGQRIDASFTYNAGAAAYDSPVASYVLSGTCCQGAAAAPTFSPPGGSYSQVQSVTLSSTTAGATIRYTTDGSEPTASSPAYTGAPIAVNASATLKAFASANGLANSPVASASYGIDSMSGPFSHGGESSGGDTTLWFRGSAGIAWVDLHFNTGAGQQNVRMAYNSAAGRHEHRFPASAGAIVTYSFTYFSASSGAADSAAFTYIVGGGGGGSVAAPAFSPPGGSFSSAQSVTLVSATSGATIRYTTDGSDPHAGSAVYSGAPISVGASATLKAYASKAGMSDSGIASAAFTITQSPGGFVHGVSEMGTTATIWFKPAATMNFVILHYQVGTGTQIDPLMSFNASLARYETVINPVRSGAVIAYSFTYGLASGGQHDSAGFTYTMGNGDTGVAKPAFSPAAGSFDSAVDVTLACTAGAVARYTVDGSAPNALSPAYGAPIRVASAATVNAICVASDGRESALASATYVVRSVGGKVAAPAFSHAAGTYAHRISVNLLSDTVGASLRYTTDGSTPTANSPAYIGPIHLGAGTTTVKAIALKSGMTNSDVASATYVLTSSGAGETWNGRTSFNIVNGTRGKFGDQQIYWAIIGKDWASGDFVHVDAGGQLVPMSLADNGALTKNGLPYTNYFFRLDQLRSVTIPPINSARLLMSVGSPMYIWVNTDGNGRIAYAGANIENPTDPNIDVVFDFGEFAILPPGNSPQGIFINTTRVDQFGFPLQLTVTGLNGFKQTVGESLTETRDELFARFIAETPAEFDGLALAPYAPYRIMAPAHATFQDEQANATYLDDYIAEVWNKYANEDLVIDLRNGWAPFTGRVVAGKFRFTDGTGTYYINGKPTTSMVMLGNGLLDDPTGASDVGKQLQLQAQVCAALNRRVAQRPFADWWNPNLFYPAGQRANHFARFFHEHSLNALSYGFAYDDVGGHSPSIHTDAPVSVTYTIGW